MMDNVSATQILKLITTSSYVLTDDELQQLEVIETIVNTGSELPESEALLLENLFEKIKRGGYLLKGTA